MNSKLESHEVKTFYIKKIKIVNYVRVSLLISEPIEIVSALNFQTLIQICYNCHRLVVSVYWQ